MGKQHLQLGESEQISCTRDLRTGRVRLLRKIGIIDHLPIRGLTESGRVDKRREKMHTAAMKA